MSTRYSMRERTVQEVAAARRLVRKYFGIPPDTKHGNGPVHLINPFETQEKKLKEHFWDEDEKTVQKTGFQRLIEKILWLRASIGPIAFCDMLDTAPELYFKKSFLMFTTKRTRIGISAHEVTHSFQKNTKLMREKTEEHAGITEYAAHWAMEGLAVLAEKNVKKDIPERAFSKIIEKIYRLIMTPIIYLIRPEALIKKIMTFIVMKANSCKKEQLAEKIDENPKLAKWIWPYSSGLSFAEEVAKKLGPRVAFELICNWPPESATELLFPEVYLQNVDKYISNVKARVTAQVDTFSQKTGIAF